MKLSGCWVPAAWATCIAHTTRAWIGKSRSKSPGDFSRDDDRLRRFEQEAEATSALNHPNILTVYDIGEHEGAPFIVAELLEGEELRRRLDEGPIPLRKATDYARQIVTGLSAAHETGIIHRDLKPENLFNHRRRPGQDHLLQCRRLLSKGEEVEQSLRRSVMRTARRP